MIVQAQAQLIECVSTVSLDNAIRMLSSASSIGLLITSIDSLEKSIGKQTPKISDGLVVVIEQQFDNEKLLLLRKLGRIRVQDDTATVKRTLGRRRLLDSNKVGLAPNFHQNDLNKNKMRFPWRRGGDTHDLTVMVSSIFDRCWSRVSFFEDIQEQRRGGSLGTVEQELPRKSARGVVVVARGVASDEPRTIWSFFDVEVKRLDVR
uniref:Uncharacterized protein n=1 Tax=Timema genevievae TaxID=629358 RepID=A0A7R9PRU8_TIMGE|nr:unnamed protein product [Timema genevievae]